MDFLGNVNVFHGRVEGGRALLGGLEVDYPEYPHDEAQPATAYVRPHELEIDHRPSDRASLAAQVVHINPAGAAVKVRAGGARLRRRCSTSTSRRERYAELGLHAGDTVYVFPSARASSCRTIRSEGDGQWRSEADERDDGQAAQALAKVRDALNGLRYGEVTVVVQDGVVVQVERTEKVRIARR